MTQVRVIFFAAWIPCEEFINRTDITVMNWTVDMRPRIERPYCVKISGKRQ